MENQRWGPEAPTHAVIFRHRIIAINSRLLETLCSLAKTVLSNPLLTLHLPPCPSSHQQSYFYIPIRQVQTLPDHGPHDHSSALSARPRGPVPHLQRPSPSHLGSHLLFASGAVYPATDHSRNPAGHQFSPSVPTPACGCWQRPLTF